MDRVLNNPLQVLIGSLFLLAGVAVYSFIRPEWQFTLLPAALHLQWLPGDFSGQLADSLPSFLHVFGFSVLSAGIIAVRQRAYIIICSLWAFINILFEILQSDLFLSPSKLNPSGTHINNPVLHWLQHYSATAVFDYYDVMAILLGAVSAYWVLMQTKHREVKHGDVRD